MIVATRQQLEARCKERNYDMTAAMACVVSQDGDTLQIDETHPAYPRKRPGLGDRVASALSAVGITKARAQAVANAVGVKDCGCRGRQQALNRLGYKVGIGTPPPAESGPTG